MRKQLKKNLKSTLRSFQNKNFFFCNKNSEVVTSSFWATRRRAGLKILNRFNYTLLSFYQHYVEHCSSWPDLLLKSISYSEIKDLNSPLAVSRKTAYNLIQGGKKTCSRTEKKVTSECISSADIE